MKTTSCALEILCYPDGILSSCSACQNLFRSGIWLVALHIDGETYFLADSEPTKCCDTELYIIKVFATRDEAAKVRLETRDFLKGGGSIDELTLMQLDLEDVDSRIYH